MRKFTLIVVSVLLLLTAVLCGCQSITPPTYAQSTAEAMLQALNTGDYQGYVSYLTDNAKAELSESDFGVYKDYCDGKIGQYQSLELNDVTVKSGLTTVVYKAKYSLVDDVLVTMVLSGNDTQPFVDSLTISSLELEPLHAQDVTHAMLQAINSGDFNTYCFFMTQDMLARTSQDVFNSFKSFYENRIGYYVSCTLTSVRTASAKVVLVFNATYTKAGDVTVTATFIPVSDFVFIDDIYLNAPELWK
jgi:hypothetical protein